MTYKEKQLSINSLLDRLYNQSENANVSFKDNDVRITIFEKSLEWDIAKLRDKLEDEMYAVKVYDALCNNNWKHKETNELFQCSWRYAGSIVANNRRFNQDYLSFYFSGNEGNIDPEVMSDFENLGWIPAEPKEKE